MGNSTKWTQAMAVLLQYLIIKETWSWYCCILGSVYTSLMSMYRAILPGDIQSPHSFSPDYRGGEYSWSDIFDELFSILAKASFIQNISWERFTVLLSWWFLQCVCKIHCSCAFISVIIVCSGNNFYHIYCYSLIPIFHKQAFVVVSLVLWYGYWSFLHWALVDVLTEY